MKKNFFVLVILLLVLNLGSDINAQNINDEIIIKPKQFLENNMDIILDAGGNLGLIPGAVVFLYENNVKLGYFNIVQVDKDQSLARVSPIVIEKLKAGAVLKIYRPTLLFDAATYFFNQKQYDLAIEYYEKNLKENREHYPSMFNIGLIYFIKRNYEKAAYYFEEALKLNQFNISILKYSAYCDFILNREQNFLEKADRVIAIDYNEVEMKILIALIMAKYKKYDVANNALNLRDFRMNLLKAFNLLKLENPNSALTIVTENFENEPEIFASIRSGVSTIAYSKLNKPEKARENLIKFKEKYQNINTDNQTEFLDDLEGLLRTAVLANIFMSAENFEPLPATISKIATLAAAQAQRQREFEARKKEIELQSKSYSKSKFNSTLIYEVKDKVSSTAQTNPVPGANFDFNLAYQNKIGDYNVQSSVKFFRNKWDGVVFEEFKSSITHNNYRLNFGKFSAKNFADLVKHPSIEYGFGAEIKLDNILFTKSANTSIFNDNILVSKEYYKSKAKPNYFTNNILTFSSGVSKKSINAGQQKEKNLNSYETGQYLQYTFGLNYRTSVSQKLEMGVSAVHTADDAQSAILDTTSVKAIRNTSYGIDLTFNLLKNLKWYFEHGWAYYDNDQSDTASSISDKSYQSELNYKLAAENFGFLGKKAADKFAGWLKNNDIDFNLKVKTIRGNWYVEGGDQGSDGGKMTKTFTTRYARKEEKTFRLNAIDFKYEDWKNNLNGNSASGSKKGFTSKSSAKTLLPATVNYEVSYQLEAEWCQTNCSDKREKIWDHLISFAIIPIDCKYSLNYSRDHKYDLSISGAGDELKKFYAASMENSTWSKLPIKLGWQLEHKYFISTTPYNYRDWQYYIDLTFKATDKLSNSLKYTYNEKTFSNTDRNNPASANQDKFAEKVAYSVSYKFNQDLSVFGKYQYTDESYKPYSTSQYIENNYKVEIKYNF